MSEYFLVTGCGGFIGFYLCKKLIEDGCICIDNINDYYYQEIGLEALKDFESLQKSDFVKKLSDNTVINEWIGTFPKTLLKKGIKIFINWFKDYYNYQC